MVKWKAKASITRDPEIPWFVVLKCTYQADLVDALKQFPGTQYVPKNKTWLVPIELVPQCQALLQEYGFESTTSLSPEPEAPRAALPSAR